MGCIPGESSLLFCFFLFFFAAGAGEVESVLKDVKAGDVRVVPVSERCDWADFMVIASGHSAWHVKNIAQALIYKAKQKQKGADQLMLPSVEGHESGQWVVIDSGGIIVHALDEKARSYYNLESLWTTEVQPRAPNQEDLGKALAKVRRKRNNSKKLLRSVPSLNNVIDLKLHALTCLRTF